MPLIQSAGFITVGAGRTKLKAAEQKLVIALAKPQYFAVFGMIIQGQ